MTLATCDHCARLLLLGDDGRIPAHDQAGPAVRKTTGKRRQRCPGSRRPPRRVER